MGRSGAHSSKRLSPETVPYPVRLEEVRDGPGRGHGSAWENREGSLNRWFHSRPGGRSCCPQVQWVSTDKRGPGHPVCLCPFRRRESMELERIVSAALLAFVQTHLPEADLSGLDEVIFSYVLGVLEDLGPSGPSEENFDMEAFTEMMEAYVPGFAHIPRGTIGDMMQKLSGQLSDARNKENLQPQSSGVQGQVPISPEPLQRPEMLKEETRSSAAAAAAAGDTQDEATGAEEELLPGVDVLLEVFPTCSVEQAQWVLAKARGDLEEAVQMLVEGKEEGPAAWDGSNQDLPRRLRGPQKDELKSFILQKYMMVDSAEDQKIHRPMAPKEAPKKLIRYIDNQIVSTKGERFKDVRNPEAEEMKATYINLKPARKYRFH
nr:CUE domain-containing protein 2 [Saimiri boliviensis boliviensis]